MRKKPQHGHGYWTKERCRQVAALYPNTTEFRKSSPYVYQLAKEMGWFEEICLHMERLFAPKGYWNSKDNCLMEARKHKTRTSFARNAPTAYWNCLQNGWDEAFAHMDQILD